MDAETGVSGRKIGATTRDARVRWWRLAAISLGAILTTFVVMWVVRERALVRDQELERAEWERQKRGWVGRHEEQERMIERLFDSQDAWLRDVRELKAENGMLRQEVSALKAATRPIDDAGQRPSSRGAQ